MHLHDLLKYWVVRWEENEDHTTIISIGVRNIASFSLEIV